MSAVGTTLSAMQATIGDGVTTWALLDPDAAHGRGTVTPRLALQFKARTCRERMQAQIHVMPGELIAGEETLSHKAC